MKIDKFSTVTSFHSENCLPLDGLWIGRAWLPNSLAFKGIAGPHVVCVEGSQVFDLSERFLTTSELLAGDDVVGAVRSAPRRGLGVVRDLVQ